MMQQCSTEQCSMTNLIMLVTHCQQSTVKC